jgi:hypothetical protein
MRGRAEQGRKAPSACRGLVGRWRRDACCVPWQCDEKIAELRKEVVGLRKEHAASALLLVPLPLPLPLPCPNPLPCCAFSQHLAPCVP